MNDYELFLEGKRKSHLPSGFECNEEISYLFPFQNFVVNRALRHGKYAIFSGTGTGKTRMELAWSEAVVNYTGKPVLILAPLVVSRQTIEEGKKIGVLVMKYAELEKQLKYQPIQDCDDIYIANYEQIDNIDLSVFGGICLDESSILKNVEGAYRNKLIKECRDIPYKLCGTATPSPNDEMELGNHSEFLNVMSYREMLAMYFVHDAGKTQEWRLKGHARKSFYEWVSTWAIMFQKPSDIGFEQEGYDLPPLNLVETKIITEKRENGKLYNDTAVNATNFNAELRITKIERIEQAAQIANNSNESFIVWIKQNPEGELLKKLIPNSVEVTGSDSTEYKEQTLIDFADNKHRVLITKSKIAGAGMNFQNCHNQIFPSIDFSFESLFQSIRRSWRFGQKEQVNIYIITTDTMENVIESIKQKEKQFELMQQEMTAACSRTLNVESKAKVHVTHDDFISERFHLMQGDSVIRIKEIADESIDFSIQSPPFASLYVYSDELADMGNSKDYKEFFNAYGYLTKDLYRVMKAGHLVVQHCMDLPIQKGKEGYIGLRSFSNMIIEAHEKEGFILHSEVICWKNPVTEMQRTKALGLLHKQLGKDSCMSRVGIPDKLLVFRKPGENLNPVKCKISVDTWQKYASPVWMDVDFSKNLNNSKVSLFGDGCEEKDEKHIAPLSLDIIDRCLTLWTNEGDKVLSCFGGIGSEVYQSILRGRYGTSIELKGSYFKKAIQNCKAAEASLSQQKLFQMA